MNTANTKASGDEAEKWAREIAQRFWWSIVPNRTAVSFDKTEGIYADLIDIHRRATRAEHRCLELEAELAKAVGR